MAGVIQGLQTGYQIGLNIIDRQKRDEEMEYQRKRQETIDNQNSALYGAQMDRHNVYMDNADYQKQKRAVADERASALYDLQTKNQNSALALKEFQLSEAQKQAKNKEAADKWKYIFSGFMDPSSGQINQNLDPHAKKKLGDDFSSFLKNYGDLPAYSFLHKPEAVDIAIHDLSSGVMPNVSVINQVYGGLARKSVGEPARDYGTIAGNEITKVSLTKGGEAIKLHMRTYREDGSYYDSMVNNGRNSKPGTGVMEIPIDKVYEDLYAKKNAAEVAKAAERSVMAYNKANPSRTRTESALGAKDVYSAINDIDSQINELITYSEAMPDPERKAQIENRIAELSYRKDTLLKQAGQTPFNEHQEQQTLNLAKSWASDNPDKIGFLELAMQQGRNLSPEALEASYQNYINSITREQKSQKAAEKIRQARNQTTGLGTSYPMTY
ncbi:hypothetical protein [Gayadomonas joobiniege]|uniref:hypothetical protein n=1 Tax=Gayadomonas joobiniege TaxID=1234606 RepID=UPI000366D596|nr:hypothetical protein [Gayadomonas joobiniege]